MMNRLFPLFFFLIFGNCTSSKEKNFIPFLLNQVITSSPTVESQSSSGSNPNSNTNGNSNTNPVSIPGFSSANSCDLSGIIEKDNSAYRVFSFNNSNSSQSRNIKLCFHIPDEKEVLLTYTNTDPSKSYDLEGGDEAGESLPSENLRAAHAIQEDIHPDFVLQFDPFLYLDSSSAKANPNSNGNNHQNSVSQENAVQYNWKTSDSVVSSNKKCFVKNKPYDEVETTLRGVRNLSDGKILRVWVADQDWDDTDIDRNGKLHPEKIRIMMDHFSGTNGQVGIYDKVRQLSGNIWGLHSYLQLISSQKNYLDIVYYDINCDNTVGGIVGFFFSGNNFLSNTISSSNEALVFFLDSQFFSNRTGPTWEATDYHPRHSMNTLAHELQHMILFYEKAIRKGVNSPAWFNEFISMSMEDLISSHTVGEENNLIKKPNSGLNRYSQNPECSMNSWARNKKDCDLLYDYGKVSALGSYILRMDKGIKYFQNLITNSRTDVDAFQQVIEGKSFDFGAILHRSGVNLTMNGKLGELPAEFGYPRREFPNYFAGREDLSLPEGDPYIFQKKPKLFTKLPAKIEPASNINYHWKKKFSGKLEDTISVPPKSWVSVTIGQNPRDNSKR